VQIALEQLREAFPNKYVAIKTGKAGNKFVVINEFNNKSHA
jgi:spoIIIJ-associated protein